MRESQRWERKQGEGRQRKGHLGWPTQPGVPPAQKDALTLPRTCLFPHVATGENKSRWGSPVQERRGPLWPPGYRPSGTHFSSRTEGEGGRAGLSISQTRTVHSREHSRTSWAGLRREKAHCHTDPADGSESPGEDGSESEKRHCQELPVPPKSRAGPSSHRQDARSPEELRLPGSPHRGPCSLHTVPALLGREAAGLGLLKRPWVRFSV